MAETTETQTESQETNETEKSNLFKAFFKKHQRAFKITGILAAVLGVLTLVFKSKTSKSDAVGLDILDSAESIASSPETYVPEA